MSATRLAPKWRRAASLKMEIFDHFEALLYHLVLVLKLVQGVTRVETTHDMQNLWWPAATIALVVTIVFEKLWPLFWNSLLVHLGIECKNCHIKTCIDNILPN